MIWQNIMSLFSKMYNISVYTVERYIQYINKIIFNKPIYIFYTYTYFNNVFFMKKNSLKIYLKHITISQISVLWHNWSWNRHYIFISLSSSRHTCSLHTHCFSFRPVWKRLRQFAVWTGTKQICSRIFIIDPDDAKRFSTIPTPLKFKFINNANV